MSRPIGRRLHGMLDYATATTDALLAAALPTTPGARVLLGAAGGTAAALAAVTDYELGLVRVAPMRVHLAADGIYSAALAAAAAFSRDARARVAFGALAAIGAATTALTDPSRA
ncbi:MAG: hypothetical protein ACJ77E_12255 [Gaiellaceae bacterium]